MCRLSPAWSPRSQRHQLCPGCGQGKAGTRKRAIVTPTTSRNVITVKKTARQLSAGRVSVNALKEDVEREVQVMQRMALELRTLREQVDNLQANANYQDYRIAMLEQAAPTRPFVDIA